MLPQIHNWEMRKYSPLITHQQNLEINQQSDHCKNVQIFYPTTWLTFTCIFARGEREGGSEKERETERYQFENLQSLKYPQEYNNKVPLCDPHTTLRQFCP